MKCQRAEEGERERPIPWLFGFFFCSSPDTIGSFPPKDLCTHRALSRSNLISNIFPHQGPSTPLLTWPVPPAQSPGPPLFLCVAFLPLRAFFFLLPEILLFVVTTCFQNYSSQREVKLCEGRHCSFRS